MTQTNRFWTFVWSVFLMLLFLVSGILFFLYIRLTPSQTRTILSIVIEHAAYFFCIMFIICICLYTLLAVIYSTYVKPIKKISAEARVIYTSNPSHRIRIQGNKDLRNLAQVINHFADLFENLNERITEQILAARNETEKERNLLAAIMSELPQGMFICNKNGRILLFNSLAKHLFSPMDHDEAPEQFIGLGRSIYHLIDENRIISALDEIKTHLSCSNTATSACFITPIHTSRMVSVEVLPILDPDQQITGFILALMDITGNIRQYETVFESLNRFKDLLHPSAALDNLMEHYSRVSDVVLDALVTKLPMGRQGLPDFLVSLAKTAASTHDIHLKVTNRAGDEQILADPFLFRSALIFLLGRIQELCCPSGFQLTVDSRRNTILFDLSWKGPPVPSRKIQAIFAARTHPMPSFFYLLRQNNARADIVTSGDNECCRITITTQKEPAAVQETQARAPVITGSRPEFYDFNLFEKDEICTDLLEMGLKDLTYTVFDTETTGLKPDQGDEIVSIAAIRIVNGKILYQDIFEELVDPKRDIPIEAYKIHGLNYEMVQGKKEITAVLPAFRKFSDASVLVGHNIAFDMKMLKVKEKVTGTHFPNPVLDTLLLSAILHPVHEHHDLENIARRLGVEIIGRHTALGDTIATARIFLKLLPLLHSNGVLTLRDAILASKKTYYARLTY